MQRFKSRLKAFFYNNQTDYLIVTLGCLIALIFEMIYERYAFLLEIIIFILVSYYIINHILNCKQNKGFTYLFCGHIPFAKKYVWINQKVRNERKLDKCPQRVFVKELEMLYKMIPEGTIVFCCTHQAIVDKIKERFPEAEIEKAYEKNLKWLKKKIRNRKCKSCNLKKCSSLRSEKTQFYSVKFIR